MIFDLLLKGGMLPLGGDVTTCDVGIRDGQIVALGRYLASDRVCPVYDVRGQWVLPALCDVYAQSTTFAEGEEAQTRLLEQSRRAAEAGVTMLCELILPRPWESLLDAVERRAGEVKEAFVDYVFATRVTAGRVPTVEELQRARKRGLASLVATLSPRTDGLGLDDAELMMLAQRAREAKMGLSVLLEHPIFARLAEEPKGFGLKKTAQGWGHRYSERGEYVAACRALAVAEVAKLPIDLLGVSTQATLSLVQQARQRGVAVRAQVFAHSFLLSQSVYKARRGHWYRLLPPLRSARTQAQLGRAPKAWSMVWGIGMPPQPALLPFADLPHEMSPWGYPTGAMMARMLKSKAALTSPGKRLATVTSTLSRRPFAHLGFGDERGHLAVSAVADLCVWNAEALAAEGPKKFKDSTAFNHFMDLETLGTPSLVFNRGQLVAQNGKLANETPHGVVAVPLSMR